MKRVFWIFIVLILGNVLVSQPTQAAKISQSDQPEGEESYQGIPLCMPLSYYHKPVEGDCLDLGPSAYINRMIAAGIRFPIRPFVVEKIDLSHSLLNYQYMLVRDDVRKRVPVYASMEDVGNQGAAISYLETNFSYITYQEIVDGKYVLTSAGTWVSRGDVSPVAVPVFQGVTFSSTPSTDFGWMFDFYTPRSGPGYSFPEVGGVVLNTNQIVQIMGNETADGVDWHMIKEGQWVEARLVNRVMVNTTPPEGVENGRWIEVNLAEQTLSVYENKRLVFATVIATGLEPMYTRPGLFPIYQRLESTPMMGSFEADRSDFYYLENVPWTMYFDKARALHGAYWRTKLGHPQSHGCVNLSVGDAHWVFEWANDGDWVYVWDPTGLTPTDPNFYGDGGA